MGGEKKCILQLTEAWEEETWPHRSGVYGTLEQQLGFLLPGTLRHLLPFLPHPAQATDGGLLWEGESGALGCGSHNGKGSLKCLRIVLQCICYHFLVFPWLLSKNHLKHVLPELEGLFMDFKYLLCYFRLLPVLLVGGPQNIFNRVVRSMWAPSPDQFQM